jgi:DNA-binding MarR family transcriptional regulator
MSDNEVIRDFMSEADCENFRIIELLFFAYRSFVGDADEVLADYDFGRAHHRVLHFVNRVPGLTVAELLDILKITKQSLSRVLRELMESDHITQLRGASDGRKRLLYPTDKGRELALKLSQMQSRRINAAFRLQGEGQRQNVEEFLRFMIDADERAVADHLDKRGGGGSLQE